MKQVTQHQTLGNSRPFSLLETFLHLALLTQSYLIFAHTSSCSPHGLFLLTHLLFLTSKLWCSSAPSPGIFSEMISCSPPVLNII